MTFVDQMEFFYPRFCFNAALIHFLQLEQDIATLLLCRFWLFELRPSDNTYMTEGDLMQWE